MTIYVFENNPRKSQVVDQKLDKSFEAVTIEGAKGNIKSYGDLIFSFVVS